MFLLEPLTVPAKLGTKCKTMADESVPYDKGLGQQLRVFVNKRRHRPNTQALGLNDV